MSMSNKGLSRKADAEGGQKEGSRMLILDQEKCKPNMPAHSYLKKHAGACGKECIHFTSANVAVIIEAACLACLNRAKHCPGDAVKIINLPQNLETNVTHKYGANAFKLHGLPTPRAGSVLGLLGCNGIGKSTALRVLAGKLKPNLGRPSDPPDWMEIHNYYRGSELQNYFTRMLEDDLKVVIKPQLDSNWVKHLAGQNVRQVLEKCDERDVLEEMSQRLEIAHLLDREITQLSGGEMQRFAIACVVCRAADVYMFDEPSSFLDARQRMDVTHVIRDLCFNKKEEAEGKPNALKYVLVVEHDLAVLDYMSDYICCLYGEPGAYGVITKIASVRNGINNFLAGYIPAENMRFRAEELTFQVSGAETADQVASEGAAGRTKLGMISWPGMSKTLINEAGSKFTLHVSKGSFLGGEIIGLLGENGCGKTTFMELLAGNFDKKTAEKTEVEVSGAVDVSDSDAVTEHSLAGLGISYKRQSVNYLRRFKGTVQELFEKQIQNVCADRLFRLLVLRPLNMEALEPLYVQHLSGGELQRVAITICLGTPATVYLLDEPSAGLDCEQRVIVSKVIRRWLISNLQKTAFVVEHDFVMASALADRVIVYSGKPGIECTANTPQGLQEGFNDFLKALDVTFRRDPVNFRPRVNKRNSTKDREQKVAGTYFIFDTTEDPSDKEDATNNAPKKGGKKK